MWWLGTGLSYSLSSGLDGRHGPLLTLERVKGLLKTHSSQFALLQTFKWKWRWRGTGIYFCRDLSGHTFGSTSHMRNLILGSGM